MMGKTLKRLLERLRAAASGSWRGRASIPSDQGSLRAEARVVAPRSSPPV